MAVLSALLVEIEFRRVRIIRDDQVFMKSSRGVRQRHSTPVSVMTIGSAAGRLKTGLHIAGHGDPISRVGLTVMQALGLPLERWGTGSLQTSKTITEILA